MADAGNRRSIAIGIVGAMLLALPLYVVSYPLYWRWKRGPDQLFHPKRFRFISGMYTGSPVCYRPLESAMDRWPFAYQSMLWLSGCVGVRQTVEIEAFRRVFEPTLDRESFRRAFEPTLDL